MDAMFKNFWTRSGKVLFYQDILVIVLLHVKILFLIPPVVIGGISDNQLVICDGTYVRHQNTQNNLSKKIFLWSEKKNLREPFIHLRRLYRYTDINDIFIVDRGFH